MANQRPGPERCRRKFLKFFPEGFDDETYVDWERDYKWEAHERWNAQLSQDELRSLLEAKEFAEVARRAVTIESRTNLLFSFEKMAMRDAVKSRAGARAFAEGLQDFLHGSGDLQTRFERWIEVVAGLPRKQTRVLTWPVTTVFGFIAQPDMHVFLKPMVTKRAAEEYGFEFLYRSRPSWETYASLLSFAKTIWKDVLDLRPKDLIDIQGFIWVQGSDEY
ncbi:MAG TPA: hypothetical protein VHM24_11200 [Gemmatimonadaceae bacterium]|nr:hypothetical protein [Gemmatimonadaceae bacterium]